MRIPLPPQMCQTISRVRLVTTGEDAYGNPITTTQQDDFTSCLVAPLQGSPFSESQGTDFDRIVMSWKLFTPPGVDLLTTDHIQQGADRFQPVSGTNPAVLDLQVYGVQAVWPGMDGTTHHTEAMLKVWGG